MALDNLKDFTMQGLVGGFLLVSLLVFAISFMAANNPTGLGDGTSDRFTTLAKNSTTNLLESPTDSDVLLNITANTNPETGDLGSRDSVASAYSASGNAKEIFETSKDLIGWVFTGTPGKILLGSLAGIIGFLAWYFITKFIRQGL